MKIPLYITIAVFIGLLIILVPLVAFVELRTEDRFSAAESLSNGFQAIEGSYGLGSTRSSVLDFEASIVSFAVAIAVYLLARRKIG